MGVRKDLFAEAHRIPVEEVKTETDRGRYLHPELYETESAKSDIGSIGELRRMFLEQGHVKHLSRKLTAASVQE